MYPSLIQIGSKTAEKNSAQTNRQTERHYENNGHLAVNQKLEPSDRENMWIAMVSKANSVLETVITVDAVRHTGA